MARISRQEIGARIALEIGNRARDALYENQLFPRRRSESRLLGELASCIAPAELTIADCHALRVAQVAGE